MRDHVQIDFLGKGQEEKARKTTVIAAAVFTLFVGIFALIGAGASYRAATQGTTFLGEFGQFFSFNDFKGLAGVKGVDGPKDPFATPDNRLNILLLGVGGEGHAGSQLTDTIILASLDRDTKKIGMVSIPRDMAYQYPDGHYEKINSVHAYAERDHPGEGTKYTAEAFSKFFNVRIDRVLRIDFKGFAEFVDKLGGIDVNVERSFTDRQFPTDDDGPDPYKIQTVTFTKGMEHMDGKRTLIYVRSRHGNNGEGSDFARSRRQQIVLEAVRAKMLSLGTLGNPAKVTELWEAISQHIVTDIGVWDAVKLLPLASNFSSSNITTNVISDGPTGLLALKNNMYFPKKEDWSDVRDLIANPFTTKEYKIEAAKPVEKISLEVRNGTFTTGLAAQMKTRLENAGYTVVATGNAGIRNYQKSVIYDLTNGEKSGELAKLKKLLDANVATTAPVEGSVLSQGGTKEKIMSSSTQFLIILGNSSANLTP